MPTTSFVWVLLLSTAVCVIAVHASHVPEHAASPRIKRDADLPCNPLTANDDDDESAMTEGDKFNGAMEPTWGPYRLVSEDTEALIDIETINQMFLEIHPDINPFSAFATVNDSDIQAASGDSLCEPTVACLVNAFWGFVGIAGPCGFGHTHCASIAEVVETNLNTFHMDIILNNAGRMCGATGAGLKALLTGPAGVAKMGIVNMIGCATALIPQKKDVCDDIVTALRLTTGAIARFFCQAYGRGVGVIPGCRAGETKSGLLCYPNCRAGYYAVGPVCWEHCAPGYKDAGAICGKSFVDWYFKKSYGNGVGSPLNTCPPHRPVWDAGLCYVPCKEGYKGVGPMCWPNFGK